MIPRILLVVAFFGYIVPANAEVQVVVKSAVTVGDALTMHQGVISAEASRLVTEVVALRCDCGAANANIEEGPQRMMVQAIESSGAIMASGRHIDSTMTDEVTRMILPSASISDSDARLDQATTRNAEVTQRGQAASAWQSDRLLLPTYAASPFSSAD